MILFIDATEYNQVTFAVKDKKSRRKTFKISSHESSRLLEKLEEFLKPTRNPVSEIRQIVVNAGPGSFTGVRVSLAIAQALSLAWGVKMKASPKDKFVIN